MRRAALWLGTALLAVLLAGAAAVVLRNTAGPPPVYSAPPPPVGTAPAEPPQSAEPPPAQPVHRPAGQPPGTVRLPVGGTAELVRREIDRSGTLPVPDDIGEATWWGAGLDAPAGAAVLAGHVNWGGRTGPFAELWRTRPGQLITVTGREGTAWRYRVTEVLTLSKEELPARAPELFSQGGRHRLVLVTCGGRYVGGDLGYTDNRIVIAEPV